MPKTERHLVWQLYLALAAEGGRTASEGVQAIKALFPTTFAGDVDAVLAVEGDLTRLEPEMRDRYANILTKETGHIGNQAMNAKIREPQSTGRATLTGTGSEMNEQIRAFRTGSRISIEG